MNLSDILFDVCESIQKSVAANPEAYEEWRAEITAAREGIWNLAKKISSPPGLEWDADNLTYRPKK